MYTHRSYMHDFKYLKMPNKASTIPRPVLVYEVQEPTIDTKGRQVVYVIIDHKTKHFVYEQGLHLSKEEREALVEFLRKEYNE